MAKGARLFPLQVTRLYERMIAVVDRKRKEPTKMYYKTKKGRHFIERYTPEQIWCRDFLTFIRNKEDFERFQDMKQMEGKVEIIGNQMELEE